MLTINICQLSDVLKLLIDSLVLLHLTYALPVWDPATSKQCVMRLQRQHNWAVCIVKNLRKFDHVSARQVKLGWLSMHSLISTWCPPTFAYLTRCYLSQTRMYFHYQGSKWWNNLPDSIIITRDFSSTLYS